MRGRAVIVLLLWVWVVPGLGAADVSYEEETKMGGLAQVATLGRAVKTKTEVSGGFMRMETGSETTLVDLDQEKVFTLDTKKKTFTEMTFEELRERLESAMTTAQEKQGGSQGESADVTASTEVRVNETGRTEEIGGHACRQFLIEFDVTLESEKEQSSGTMTMLSELWVANRAPGVEELQAFQQKMLEKLGTRSLAQTMFGDGADQQNPFGMDTQRMADEMSKIDGFPMRTVVYFGSGDAARKEAMGEKPAGGGGLGGMLKKMTLPGAAGGSEQGDPDAGAVVMRVTTETKKIETKAIDAKRFAVPEGYKKVDDR